MVYRVCVEKKPGLAPECASLLSDCRSFLDLEGLESVRIWNRYDVEGIDEALFAYATNTVFSEPQLDLTSYSAACRKSCPVRHPGAVSDRSDKSCKSVRIRTCRLSDIMRNAKIPYRML